MKIKMIKNNDYNDVIDNDDGNDDEFEEIQVTLKLKKNIAQVGRLIAKHFDEDFDQFISEEVPKIIYALSTTPIISDELKQQIQSLLKDENI